MALEFNLAYLTFVGPPLVFRSATEWQKRSLVCCLVAKELGLANYHIKKESIVLYLFA